MSHTERTHSMRAGRRPGPFTRTVAAICALALAQLQLTGLTQGHWLAEARAQAVVTNTMAVLVVPPNSRSLNKAAALERLLGSYLPRLEQIKPFDLAPVEGAEEGKQAGVLIEEALRALLLRTPQRAADRLKAASVLLNKHPNAGDVRVYARFHKANGLTALARQKLVEARNALLQSMVLYPKQTEEEYVAYGALARDLFKTVKTTFDGAPTGDMVLKTTPAGANIWIDGVFRGASPMKVSDLPIGEHRVLVRQAGMDAQRQFVTVTADKPVAVDFKLVDAAFAQDLRQGRSVLIANFNQPTVIEDRIRELRNELGTDQILVVRAAFSRVDTEMKGYFLGADGTFKKVHTKIPKDVEYLNGMATFISEAAGVKLLPDPADAPLDHRKSVVVASKTAATKAATADIDPNAPLFQDDKEVEVPITSKWWFWAAVGGGAAVLAGGIVLLMSGTEEGPQGATGTLKIHLNQTSGN